MPQAFAMLPLIISSYATTVIGANLLYLGTLAVGYAALAVGGALLSSLLVDKPSVPKPDDGSYNLKQSVPSLSIVLGRRKKGSDYAALEEKDGTAYHVLIVVGHRIQGFFKHYLHDEEVTLDVDGYTTAPANFGNTVRILTRNGLKASTAYTDLVTAFPGIFTNDHRGDGLATVRMSCATVSADDYLDVFPNQMPQHSSVVDGALLFDPRNEDHDPLDEETWTFGQNIPLERLWQLTHPVGGKQNLSDVYLPEFAHAADVADQSVLNRDGDPEPRYHGGIYFRANNSQIDVGRMLDQAAEMVVYERPDGLIGVHAGEFVEPDIRLTADDIHTFGYKANKSEAATVLAVRGRFTSAESAYNTVDAAIWGDPYIGEDTERTRTLDNQVIERHNHCQRLQKITMIRANAPRVAIKATYESAKNASYRRFVKVHYPPYCDEAIVEIISSPKFSFRDLTVEFSGIVVPANIFDFDAETEEGEPPTVPVKVAPTGVPMPVNFTVTIGRDAVSGSNNASFALAEWDHTSNALVYEFEWQATSGPNQLPVTTISKPGEDEVKSSYLPDGVPHRYRLRTLSNGAKSAWTAYQYATPIADPVAPAVLTAFTQTAAAPHLGNAVFSLTTPNDAHQKTVKLYKKLTGAALTTAADVIAQCTQVGAPLNVTTAAATYSGIVDGDVSRTNLLTDADFATSPGPWTLGTGWTISGGAGNKTAGNNTLISQPAAIAVGKKGRLAFDISAFTAGSCVSRLTNGTNNYEGPGRAAIGTYLETTTAVVATTTFAIRGSATFVGSIDNVRLYEETATCAPQGVWDYYAVPFNGSDIAGTPSGPVTVTII